MGMTTYPSLSSFRHEALLYEGADAFVAQTTKFIREGVEADEPVLVVVGAEKIGWLRESLGDLAQQVAFADMADVGANPARIIPAWYDFVADHGGAGRPMRGIGEPISLERAEQPLVECQRHESLLNLAFAEGPSWWLLCPYDTTVLPVDVIEEALRSHPHYWSGDEHHDSSTYRTLDAIGRPFDHPLPEPSHIALELPVTLDALDSLRGAVSAYASSTGMSIRRVDDLVIAANEIAINSLRHGGGGGVLRAWQEHDVLCCEVRDSGRLDAPLVGRKRPDEDQEGGFGIWLVHQLCDLVQIRTFEDGTVVRMHMDIR